MSNWFDEISRQLFLDFLQIIKISLCIVVTKLLFLMCYQKHFGSQFVRAIGFSMKPTHLSPVQYWFFIARSKAFIHKSWCQAILIQKVDN